MTFDEDVDAFHMIYLIQTYGSRKSHEAAARMLQDMQRVRTTDIIVSQP